MRASKRSVAVGLAFAAVLVGMASLVVAVRRPPELPVPPAPVGPMTVGGFLESDRRAFGVPDVVEGYVVLPPEHPRSTGRFELYDGVRRIRVRAERVLPAPVEDGEVVRVLLDGSNEGGTYSAVAVTRVAPFPYPELRERLDTVGLALRFESRSMQLRWAGAEEIAAFRLPGEAKSRLFALRLPRGSARETWLAQWGQAEGAGVQVRSYMYAFEWQHYLIVYLSDEERGARQETLLRELSARLGRPTRLVWASAKALP